MIINAILIMINLSSLGFSVDICFSQLVSIRSIYKISQFDLVIVCLCRSHLLHVLIIKLIRISI